MKVFVTGGTGFVGREILGQLLSAGHEVRALVRDGSQDKLSGHQNLETHIGDVTDAASLIGVLDGCDAVIHLVGIIREFPGRGITFKKMHVTATENILEACDEQEVQRFLHMSSNGTRERGSTAYHRTKWQAEELVRASGLDWTIFRPSLIFGRGSEFVKMLTELIRRVPVVPVIGDGQYRMQPVSVEQVAVSFVKALAMPESIGKTYHQGGSESYTYDAILDLTGKAMGRKHVTKVHQPLFMIKPMIKMLQGFEQFPITEGQLKMLIEGNVCDPDEWAQAFGLVPISYADGIGECV
ncbi:MAG: complex I NDUFA9 subunit family protein [Deltaproteobacteria bacterium]|nr:complex I NDUFA9 subunit family protein [Deltaproteobacteria bacterium]MDH4007810.1 complex I NDUFA9 subunit family protein [Desulfuromonadales bacterium]